MKKISLLLVILFISVSFTFALEPKVVILIVLDQFPYNYIGRFQPYFSVNGGFNYLLKHGASFVNAEYGQALTKTAPGHAAIATGTYSHINGIIANGWYDREHKKWINCVDDDSTKIIGNAHGGRSPNKLLAPTLGDMLNISSNYRSKVISISFKDRAAILTAGKTGKAYWIEDSLVVTSTYYIKELPTYLDRFNKSGKIKEYFGKKWIETNPVAAIKVCDIDDAPYEADFGKIGKAFPHFIAGTNRSSVTPSYYTAMEHSPFATEFMLELARTVFVNESLGTRGAIDMLTIGISTPDEIGHAYGPDSHEAFDDVLQTDLMLGKFFSFLDSKIGLENCTIALTSDHGISPIPELTKKRSPATETGRVNSKEIRKYAEDVLDREFGNDEKNSWIESIAEWDIYLNKLLLHQKNIPADSAMRILKIALLQLNPVAEVMTRNELIAGNFQTTMEGKIEKSFNPLRNGDVLYVLKPNYIISGDSVGTNHGEPYECDSHVPLMMAGRNIRQGIFKSSASPIDIVPTLAVILRIECPPNIDGKVLREAIK